MYAMVLVPYFNIRTPLLDYMEANPLILTLYLTVMKSRKKLNARYPPENRL